MAEGEKGETRKRERLFLVVVDETEEMHVALRFAALRARKTGGRVALLHVIEPADFQHWLSVGDLMQDEKREEAERLLQELSKEVETVSGRLPLFYVRTGSRRDELLKLIAEEPDISILILGASTSQEGPGPLVSHLASKMAGKLRIPFAIVPGGLSNEELDDLT